MGFSASSEKFTGILLETAFSLSDSLFISFSEETDKDSVKREFSVASSSTKIKIGVEISFV